MFYSVIIPLLVLYSGRVSSQCPSGFCALGNSSTCTIPADSECDNCYSRGQCFHDRPSELSAISNEYFCSCEKERYGKKCEHVYYSKQFSWYCNCSDHGMCFGSSVCACYPGWQGNHCEYKVREIQRPNAWCCHNGGSLYRQGDEYGCLCPCGFAGEFCEFIRPEVLMLENGEALCSDLCKDDGKCVKDDVTSEVTCKNSRDYPFRCPYIKQWRTKCNNGILKCLNGGSCIGSRYYEPTCQCLPGYTGDYCETKYATYDETVPFEKPSNTAMYIALVSSVPLAVLIIIAALIVVIYKHFRLSRRRSPNQDNHNTNASFPGPPSYNDVTETTFQSTPPSYEESIEKPPPYSEIDSTSKWI